MKDKLLELFPSLKSKELKAGGTSFLLGVVVFLLLVVVNVLVSFIPSNYTQFDMSSAHLYSISSSTKVVVNALEKDVDIYWICQAGEEDDVIERLLDKYDSLSEHLNVVRKDPDVYPTFARQYTSSTVQNNSIIVECDNKYRYIDYDEIYVASGNAYASYYETTTYSFDGEGAITSAIDYVVSEDLPKIYFLSGHGEEELSDSLMSAVNKENYETDSLSLLNSEIPEDCDILVIYAPSSDISEVEKDTLLEYLKEGGHILSFVGPIEDGTLTNFATLLDYFGVTTNEGIVIESDSDHYIYSIPYLLMPSLNSEHELTNELDSNNYNVLVPISAGYTLPGSSSYEVNALLSTSESAYSKVSGYNLTTYELEEGDIEGQFALAVCIEQNSGQDDSMKFISFGSDFMLDDIYNSYSSGANEQLFLNCLAYLSNDDNAAVSIRAKSLSYEYLTISSTTSTYLKIVMIGIIPLVYLWCGIDTVIKRRKK